MCTTKIKGTCLCRNLPDDTVKAIYHGYPSFGCGWTCLIVIFILFGISVLRFPLCIQLEIKTKRRLIENSFLRIHTNRMSDPSDHHWFRNCTACQMHLRSDFPSYRCCIILPSNISSLHKFSSHHHIASHI